ncbi:MAG: tetratricopeptide repeat protein [Sphingobacteriales bacterium]|nr:tetratricopeptide repeat protein [Sphingobacteriales bacterium]
MKKFNRLNLLAVVTVLISFVSLEAYSQSALEFFKEGYRKNEIRDYYGAIHDYNKAIVIDPFYVKAYNNRGIAYFKLFEFKDALKDFTKAISLKADYIDAYYNRGMVKGIIGDYYGAIRDFDAAIKLDSNFADAYNSRGIAKGNVGIYKDALSILIK